MLPEEHVAELSLFAYMSGLASTSLEYTPPAPSTGSIFGGNQMYTFVRMESPTPIPVSQDSMGG